MSSQKQSAKAQITPAQRRLAEGLTKLKRRQDAGTNVLRSEEIPRLEREALLANGFLAPIMRGWYISSRPDESGGDTTAWYASAYDFIRRYCDSRFGDDWCLSADLSVRLHAGDTQLPRQVQILTPNGTNDTVSLPAGHSLLNYRTPTFPTPENRGVVSGLRVMALEHALVRLTDAFFRSHPRDVQVALLGLQDSSELLRQLLDGGHGIAAGRLAGALRACNRPAFADDITSVMRRAGYVVTEYDPFLGLSESIEVRQYEQPYATRIRLLWKEMREVVLAAFPTAPGLPPDSDAYMKAVKESYVRDAYNSLSIEGYRVTAELIERVSQGTWSPGTSEEDQKSRDAMAARGYFLAKTAVESSLTRILAGENSGEVAADDHRKWYRELFRPSVDAGILKAGDLAGYRGHPVYIRNARHVPPSPETVRYTMPLFFELLRDEPQASVRAVLGHFIFVFIHPYPDGNGRMGRFLMNAMLASGGYPWTVVELKRRKEYMEALNAASSDNDIRPFAEFIAGSVQREAGSGATGRVDDATA
jgi:hypothetical protein